MRKNRKLTNSQKVSLVYGLLKNINASTYGIGGTGTVKSNISKIKNNGKECYDECDLCEETTREYDTVNTINTIVNSSASPEDKLELVNALLKNGEEYTKKKVTSELNSFLNIEDLTSIDLDEYQRCLNSTKHFDIIDNIDFKKLERLDSYILKTTKGQYDIGLEIFRQGILKENNFKTILYDYLIPITKLRQSLDLYVNEDLISQIISCLEFIDDVNERKGVYKDLLYNACDDFLKVLSRVNEYALLDLIYIWDEIEFKEPSLKNIFAFYIFGTDSMRNLLRTDNVKFTFSVDDFDSAKLFLMMRRR